MSEENNSSARRKEDVMPSVSNDLDESEQEKRQCITPNRPTICSTFGEIPASPPKFISLEELMKASNGITNMVLAHEIAVNKDFKLEKFEAPENSGNFLWQAYLLSIPEHSEGFLMSYAFACKSQALNKFSLIIFNMIKAVVEVLHLKKKVEEVVHKAFWDVLESELAEDPPNYSQAMSLLADIKNGLLELLLPQHTKIHQQISEVLDIDLIKQQARAGALDFQQYAQYVISVMGKLCAPVRDEKIANLSKTTNVIEVFKGILETIDLMKLDMANFTINLMRPHIVANSIQYEKKKFQDFLNLDEDGLVLTKQWLEKHLQVADQHADRKKKITAVINDAYLELLEWNELLYEFPETIVMDKGRVLKLKQQFERLTLAGAILLLTFAHSGPDLCSIDDFKQNIKNDTLILLQNSESNGQEDLKCILEEISEKLKHDIQGAIDQYGVKGCQTNATNLSSQLSELIDNDHKIRNLLKKRIREFLLATITSQTAEPMKIPPGFSILQEEVTQLAGNFLRLTSHNRAVYEEYYTKIIEDFLN